MAEKHLGLPFDIHGGGADLKFPHHENEIAQSCCAHGRADDVESFSKYWVHNGFVTVEGEKMSKSLGNFLLVHDLIEQYQGEVLRLALLSAHYRQPLDWGEQCLYQCQKLLDKAYQKLEDLKDVEAKEKEVPVPILNALCDDLNTPLVIAEINKILKEQEGEQLKSSLLAIGDLMGIFQQDASKWSASQSEGVSDEEIAKIEALIAQRIEAKDNKDFDRADEIRGELSAMGIEIKDTREGTDWEKVA
jgi:cysteinyl-tRNA synthetase